MLARATGNFVQQVDPGGSLIPVTRQNDSDKLDLLALVLKRQRFWFWQQPKYRPSDFTLNDVLLGDTPILPGVVESDFLKYEGTYGDGVSGRLEGGVGLVNVNMEGRGSSKLKSSFGNLRKQEVDVQTLLQASRDRMLNLQHGLMRQVQGRGRGRGPKVALAVLKERIVSTQPCSISQQEHRLASCSTMLSLITPTNVQVSVQENGSLETDSSISLEIPEGTVIAYSVLELHVKHNGQYELCLQPDALGGFEVDGPVRGNGVGGGPEPEEQSIRISVLQKELAGLKSNFQHLATVPIMTRSSLFHCLQQVLSDPTMVRVLQNVVEEQLDGGASSLAGLEELTPSQERCARGLLDLLQNAPPPNSDLQDAPPPMSSHQNSPPANSDLLDAPPPISGLLTAMHLLLSAMAEMTDAGLAHLCTCCSPPVLKSLQDLVNGGSVNGESALADEGVCQRVALLFSSSNMVLRRQMGRLWAEPGPQPGLRPLVLCIAVQGLAALCTGL